MAACLAGRHGETDNFQTGRQTDGELAAGDSVGKFAKGRQIVAGKVSLTAWPGSCKALTH